MLVIFLVLAAIALPMTMYTAQLAGSLGGHLPWPLAQWALTTPLGTLTAIVVVGLVMSIPYSMFFRVIFTMSQPVDVTDLPLEAWPDPLFRWGDPAGMTRGERWLGLSQPERARNRRALALAALLLLSLLATAVVTVWYVTSHSPDCSAVDCPVVPDFTAQMVLPLEFVGVPLANLLYLVWTISVERRSGVWFRSRGGYASLWSYIRRPGVTSEAAAAALQRNLRGANSLAQVILLAVLALVLVCLLYIGVALLAHWLATQWIPR
jgi:hypothetical protein